jgi:hypothetical protein
MLYAIKTVLEKAWQQLSSQASSLLPNLLAAFVIILLGALLGWVVRRVAGRVFHAADLDRRADRWGLASSLESLGILSTVRLLARALEWLVIFLSLILALYSLSPALASDLTLRFLLYLPHLFVAAAILAAGLLLSRFLARGVLIAAVNAEMPAARLLSTLTRVAVMLVAIAASLEHLGVARTTVLTAFAIVFGGAVLSAALALGLGSQDLVRRWLAGQFDQRPPHDAKEPFHHR